VSFVFAVSFRPRSQTRESAEAFKGPRVSKANGLKMCVLDKHACLSSLRAAASSAAEPAVRDEEAMYEAADVQITVTSQMSGLPCAHGTKVRPSGLFPSDRDRPLGSLMIGVPVAVNALAIMSLRYR